MRVIPLALALTMMQLLVVVLFVIRIRTTTIGKRRVEPRDRLKISIGTAILTYNELDLFLPGCLPACLRASINYL
jgi:hypothetical protein